MILTLDSLSADHPYPVGRAVKLGNLGVGFYELPRTDSSGVFPFHTQSDPGDQITFEELDFGKCEVRGSLRATLFYPNDPTRYPIQGVFWGRMLNNSVTPGPC